MADLAKLVVKLEAESSKLRAELERSNKRLDRFGKNTKRVSAIATKAFGAIATAAAGIQFTAMIKSTIDAGDQLQKMSIRLGATTEALSQMRHVADLSGVSFETLTMGMQRMTRRVSEAANGTGEAVAALNELGVSAKLLEKLRPEQQFEVLADSLSQVKNESDRVRLAMKLFDSEGVALLQTMQNGAAGIRQMRDEADRLGLTLTQDMANQMAAANDAATRFDARMMGIRNTIAIAVIPTMEALANFAEDNLPWAINIAGKAVDNLRSAGFGLASVWIDQIGSLQKGIGQLVQVFDPAAAEKFFKAYRDSIEQSDRLLQESIFHANGGNSQLAAPAPNAPAPLDISKYSGSTESLASLNKKAADSTRELSRLQSEAARIIEQTRTPLENLNLEIERYSMLADKGLISQEVLNRALIESGTRYNELTDSADALTTKLVESTDVMSVFSEQAARNIQDAFADFLFDPFNSRLDEMLLNFVNVIRRMAAEQISAMAIEGAIDLGKGLLSTDEALPGIGQAVSDVTADAGAEMPGVDSGVTQGDQLITDAVTGSSENSIASMISQFLGLGASLTTSALTTNTSFTVALAAQTTALTTALSAQTLAITGAIAGGSGAETASSAIGAVGAVAGAAAHTGAVIGHHGAKNRNVNPAWYANAPRFHEGGVPGLKANEVPSVLLKGEEVLARDDPRNALNGGLNGGQQGGWGGGVRILNTIDPEMTREFMESSQGEEVLINHISRNAGQIKQLLA